MNSLLHFELPLVDLKDMDPTKFISYYLENKSEFEQTIEAAGALKFRGVQIESIESFQNIINSISDKFLNYIDGNSPRTKLTGNIYTSTEYDKAQKITMHNELSYSASWPNQLFFTCLIPSDKGGETLLADSREILRKMPEDIVEEVRSKGLTYIRNLHGGRGMGPSWQETFETKDKNKLEEYCQKLNIQYEWIEGNMLKLKQFHEGIIRHRKTGELVWFNQIDQFHPCHLGGELYEVMLSLYPSVAEFPMYVEFGDGTQIEEKIVKEIIHTIDGLTVAPEWNKNELLIIDNELVCHGRNSYDGERKVLVSMSK